MDILCYIGISLIIVVLVASIILVCIAKNTLDSCISRCKERKRARYLRDIIRGFNFFFK